MIHRLPPVGFRKARTCVETLTIQFALRLPTTDTMNRAAKMPHAETLHQEGDCGRFSRCNSRILHSRQKSWVQTGREGSFGPKERIKCNAVNYSKSSQGPVSGRSALRWSIRGAIECSPVRSKNTPRGR